MRAARLGITAGLAMLAGCSMAPSYEPPTIGAPAAYKEIEGWTQATPMDGQPRGSWWSIFDDPVLNDLEARMEQASPSLAAALARYDQARAAARGTRADLFPTVTMGAEAVRERLSGRRPQANGSATNDDFTVGASLDYELDLWGRVRNSVRASQAEAAATGDDLASARLSLQATVADAYFRLRGLDAETALLRQTVEAYGRAFDLTNTRHSGGIASGVDVSRARTILSDARAQLASVINERALVEHEIAVLIGAVASDFSIPVAIQPLQPPAIPVGAPSELLQRRPDIAAAERRMAAANARIGVARAAFFPSLTLGASGGFEASHGQLFDAPSRYWALGPLSALMTVFDVGRRQAGVRISEAEYDEAAADYRSSVLSAFRDVEDGLSSARNMEEQAKNQSDASTAANRTRDLALIRYRDGASDYLDVVTAQTAALDAERALISLQAQRMRNSIALVRAVGGGFDSSATNGNLASTMP